MHLDPLEANIAPDTISNRFCEMNERGVSLTGGGTHVGHTTNLLLSGELSVNDIIPLDLVDFPGHGIYSPSSRRLFVLRVCNVKGVVRKVLRRLVR